MRVFISGEDLGGVVSCFAVQQLLTLVTDSYLLFLLFDAAISQM